MFDYADSASVVLLVHANVFLVHLLMSPQGGRFVSALLVDPVWQLGGIVPSVIVVGGLQLCCLLVGLVLRVHTRGRVDPARSHGLPVPVVVKVAQPVPEPLGQDVLCLAVEDVDDYLPSSPLPVWVA